MRHFSYILLLSLLISCTNNSSDQSRADADSTLPAEMDTSRSNSNTADFDMLTWSTDFDTTKRDFVLRQHRKVDAATLNPEKVLRELNNAWPEIILVLKMISNDTIYVSIPNSFYLTQSIGTSGAFTYISSTTYILTELRNVKFVNFDFEEGDHVVPGTYSREDFAKFLPTP